MWVPVEIILSYIFPPFNQLFVCLLLKSLPRGHKVGHCSGGCCSLETLNRTQEDTGWTSGLDLGCEQKPSPEVGACPKPLPTAWISCILPRWVLCKAFREVRTGRCTTISSLARFMAMSVSPYWVWFFLSRVCIFSHKHYGNHVYKWCACVTTHTFSLKFLWVIAVVRIFHHAHLSQYYLRTKTFSYKIKTKGLGRWLRGVRACIQIPSAKPDTVTCIYNSSTVTVRLEMDTSPENWGPGILKQLARDPALKHSAGWGPAPTVPLTSTFMLWHAHVHTPTSMHTHYTYTTHTYNIHKDWKVT